MIEVKRFSDFYYHINDNPEALHCPECGTACHAHFYTGLMNMNTAGKAQITCQNPACHFSKNPICIEAVPGGAMHDRRFIPRHSF